MVFCTITGTLTLGILQNIMPNRERPTCLFIVSIASTILWIGRTYLGFFANRLVLTVRIIIIIIQEYYWVEWTQIPLKSTWCIQRHGDQWNNAALKYNIRF